MLISFSPIDSYFTEKIRNRCLDLLTGTRNNEYFLVLTGLLEVINFEYNKPFIDFEDKEIFNYDHKELENKLYESIFYMFWQDNTAKIIELKDGIKGLEYNKGSKKLTIIPYLVKDGIHGQHNVGNRGYAGKLRDDEILRAENTCIIILDSNPIDTLITASDKKILDKVFNKRSLRKDFESDRLPKWYNELIHIMLNDRMLHSLNIIQRLEIIYKLKLDGCTKPVNEYIKDYNLPLFYFDSDMYEIHDNYNLFCNINSEKMERVTSNFIKEVADKLNLSYLPEDYEEIDIYEILRKDSLHTSNIYVKDKLTFKVIENIFNSSVKTKIKRLVIEPNNKIYYELKKTKKEVEGILSKGNLQKINLKLEGEVSQGDKLFLHYYFNNLKKQTKVIEFSNKECTVELQSVDQYQILNIVINQNRVKSTKALLNGKFILQNQLDKIAFPDFDGKIEWEKGQLYPTLVIDEIKDNNLSCVVIDENGGKTTENCELANTEILDEERRQFELQHNGKTVTKIIIKSKENNRSLVYNHLLHFISERGIEALNDIKFEEEKYTSFIYKNQVYDYYVDYEFIKLLNKYNIRNINELYFKILDNPDQHYWKIDLEDHENLDLIQLDNEILYKRKQVLKRFFNIYNSSQSNNTENFKYYHEAIVEYLSHFINIIDSYPELIKLDIIEIENKRLFSPFSPINLAFYLMCWNSFTKNEVDLKMIKRVLSIADNSEVFKYIRGDSSWFVSRKNPSFLWNYYVEEGSQNNYGKEKYTSTIIRNKIKQLKSIYPYLFQIDKQTIQIAAVNPGDANFLLNGITEYFKDITEEIESTEYTTYFHVSLIYSTEDTINEYCAFDELFEKNTVNSTQSSIVKYVSYSKTTKDKMLDHSNSFYHLLFVKDIFEVSSNPTNMYNEEEEYLNTYFSNGLNCHPLTKVQYFPNYVTYISYCNYVNLFNNDGMNLFEKVLNSVNKHFTKAFTTNLINNTNSHPLRTVNVTLQNIPFKLFDLAFMVTFLDREVDIDIFNAENITDDKKPFLIDYSNFTTRGHKEGDIKFLTITNQKDPFVQLFKHALEDYSIIENEDIVLNQLFSDINLLNGFWALELLSSKENLNSIKGILGTIAAFRYLKKELSRDTSKWHIIIGIEEFIGIDPKYRTDISKRFDDRIQQKYCDDLAIVSFPKNIKNKERFNLDIQLVEVKNSPQAEYVKKGFIQLKETKELLNRLFVNVDELTFSLRVKEIVNLLMYNRNKYFMFDKAYLGLNKNWNDQFSNDLKKLIEQMNHINVNLDIKPGVLVNVNATNKSIDEIEIEIPTGIDFKPIKEDEFINLISERPIEYNDNHFDKYEYEKVEKEVGKVAENEKVKEKKNDAKEIEEYKEKEKNEEKDKDKYKEIKEGKEEKFNFKTFCGRKITSSAELVFYDPKRQGDNLSNMNVMITGSPGRGKTQLLKSMIIQQRKQNVNFLIFDFKNDFGDDEFLQLSNMEYVNLEIEGLPYNPLIPPKKKDRQIEYMNIEAHIHAIAGVFKSVYSLGIQQEASLKNVIRNSYSKKGIDMNKRVIKYSNELVFPVLDEIREEFQEENSNAYARLDPIFSYGLFGKESRQVALSDLLNKSYVFNLSSIANDEIKNAIAKILVVSSHQYLNSLNHSQLLKNIFVFDEAHRFLDEPKLESLVRECRAYGLAVWLSSQYPSDFPDSISSALESKIIHGNGDDEAKVKAIKKLVGGGSEDMIKNLGLFDAIFTNYHYRKAFIKTLSYPHALILIEAFEKNKVSNDEIIPGVEKVRQSEMIQHLVEMRLVYKLDDETYSLTQSGEEVVKYFV